MCYLGKVRKSSSHRTKCNQSTDFKKLSWGFPGGAVVGNPPANAGDKGSSPGSGRSHMLRSS